MTKYATSFNGAYPFSDTGRKINLQASTNLTYTIPGNNTDKYRACFSYTQNSNVWVSLNGVAVSPFSNTSVDSYNEEFRPDIRYVQGGDVLSFITVDAAGAQVGVSLLQLPN